MNSKLSFKMTLLASVICTLSACGGGDDDSTTTTASLKLDALAITANLADNVIVSTYESLNTDAASLKTAVNALSQGTATEVELAAAQQAWKKTRSHWEASEAFLFGPVDAQGIDPLIDTWPLATTDLNAFLATGKTTTTDILGASENVQGFHAIEYLLFGDGLASNTRPASSLTANELAYLSSLTSVLKQHTQTLVDSWKTQYDPSNDKSGPYLVQVKSPGVGKVFTSQSAVVEQLLEAMIRILDEVANGKMTDPLGASIAAADTSLVESQYAWNSLTDFHNNIQSALNIYTGVKGFNPNSSTPSVNNYGLYTFVAFSDKALADQVHTEIKDAYNAIALIDGDNDVTTTEITSNAQMPFRQAIKDVNGRTRVQSAIDKLNKARSTLETKVKPLIAKTAFSG